jgi:cytochrome c oxidase subunit II
MNLFGKVTRASLSLIAAFGAAFAQAAENMPGGPAVYQLNFTAPATKIMQEIHWLHWMMLVICALIFVGVFGVMFYSILKHRKSLGHKSAYLDSDPSFDCDRHGIASNQNCCGDERYNQFRHHN